jgi:DNA-binding GntR family transcriptional regulator
LCNNLILARPYRPGPREEAAISSAEDSSAPDRLAAVLRDELFEGTLLPGTRLREEHLCERFDVGRHTARAALRLLVDRGLVVHERNRGATVPELTRERIDEFFGFRIVLELGSLRLALGRGADLSAVDAAVRELEALPEHASWLELTEVHGRIHHEIVAAADNDHLLHAYARCEEEMRVLLGVLRPDFSARRMAVLHRHLLDQLLIGGDVAVQALTDNLELAGRAALLQALHRAEYAARAIGARPVPRAAEIR